MESIFEMSIQACAKFVHRINPLKHGLDKL